MQYTRLITAILMTSLITGCAGTHGTRYVGHEVCQAPTAPQKGNLDNPQELTEQYFPQPVDPDMVQPAPVPPANFQNNQPQNNQSIPPAPSMEEDIPLPPMTTSYEAPQHQLKPVKQTPILLRPIGLKQYARIGGHSLRSTN